MSKSDPVFQNGNVVIKLCKHGYLAYNRFDNMIGLSLDKFGEWAEGELAVFEELVHPGNVILDIGAFIGTHTIFFAKKVGPMGKVLAFEPQRSSFQMLCTNLTLNALYNTQCFQAAVNDAIGTLKLPMVDLYKSGNYGGVAIEGHNDGEDIPLITIDALKLEKCDLMKIDVEGMEAKVIVGARETIKKFRPFLYVENNKTEKSKALLQILSELAYDCWWHFVPFFNPKNFFGCQERIYGGADYNMICFPKEQKMKLDSFLPVDGLEDNWQKAAQRMGLAKS